MAKNYHKEIKYISWCRSIFAKYKTDIDFYIYIIMLRMNCYL